jgi:hypothetical protein
LDLRLRRGCGCIGRCKGMTGKEFKLLIPDGSVIFIQADGDDEATELDAGDVELLADGDIVIYLPAEDDEEDEPDIDLPVGIEGETE